MKCNMAWLLLLTLGASSAHAQVVEFDLDDAMLTLHPSDPLVTVAPWHPAPIGARHYTVECTQKQNAMPPPGEVRCGFFYAGPPPLPKLHAAGIMYLERNAFGDTFISPVWVFSRLSADGAPTAQWYYAEELHGRVVSDGTPIDFPVSKRIVQLPPFE